MDYCGEALASIQLVQERVSERRVQLHPRQCQYLSTMMTGTGSLLTEKLNSLVGITSDDIRRKALRQLHFTVKRAETLVRGCCCEVEPWLESAVTLPQIKDYIVHILLDLHWWTSMVNIAITSGTWVASVGKIEQELLEKAEKDFQKLLEELKSTDKKLHVAFIEDRKELLFRVGEVLKSYSSGRDNRKNYLLATHVQTRLEIADLVQPMTNEDLNRVQSRDLNRDLNDNKLVEFIDSGTFGAVMNVQWFGRSCALKVLKMKREIEATSLSSFHHPYIVQFFRHWEAPGSSNESPPSVSPVGISAPVPSDASSTEPDDNLKLHILMERLPTDLAKHLSRSKPRVDLKRSLSTSRAAPMSQDAAIDAMLQVTKAMSCLNDSNLVHRDLKPSNLLVMPVSKEEFPELAECGYVRVKLGDFGEVRKGARSSVSTVASKVGTRVYAAPEIFTDAPERPKTLLRKADVWSFGIVFNEVLSGQPPFRQDENGGAQLQATMQNGLRPSLTVSYPDILRFIVTNCWQLWPQDRPSGQPPLRQDESRRATLHSMIQKGLRPSLPKACPDYLKFIITSCWELRPQDRPSFTDLWRLLRIAHVRSLGLIRADYDFFTFTTREGIVRRLHELPALVNDRVCGCLCLRVPSTKRPSARSEDKPLGYLVNLVGTQDSTPDRTKLDVILFEGNVGERKYLSCMDTWVQREKPGVWWPLDWLSKDFNGDIRVLVLEYCISKNGVEGVVEELQKLLIFRERWNRGHTWDRPIVLVGHSLGCVVIEQLVVALKKRADSFSSLKDNSFEANLAKVSRAFLTSLAGCFFYAPPYTGLVSNADLLKYVFGGLMYSPALFNDLTSSKLKEISEHFMVARGEGVKLMALTEGKHTRGSLVVPQASMETFKASGGRVEELQNSNHSDTCKPSDKKHPAYVFLLEFIKEVSKGKGVQCEFVESSAEGSKLTRKNTFKRFLGSHRDG